jgi:hypothetical protein
MRQFATRCGLASTTWLNATPSFVRRVFRARSSGYAVYAMTSSIFHVRPAPAGRWQVDHEGSPSVLYDDKEEALTAAVELARVRKTAVVRVYSLEGKLDSEKTYANENTD